MTDQPAPSPDLGDIVIFEEDFTAPAIVTKVEEAMEGVVPAVDLAIFPSGHSGSITRTTVPHVSTIQDEGTSRPRWSFRDTAR